MHICAYVSSEKNAVIPTLVDRQARVVYVGNDSIVLSHGLLAANDRATSPGVPRSRAEGEAFRWLIVGCTTLVEVSRDPGTWSHDARLWSPRCRKS